MKKMMAIAACLSAFNAGQAAEFQDSTRRVLDNVVVTGTRNRTDIRHLPMTLSIIDRPALEETQRVNILPTLSEQVPGLFVTQRGMFGFGVSTGAAGGLSLRGISGGNGGMMVLIDGHPQYQGIFGHPISDAYQTLLAERVEVLRGPASLLYGSNAMGGVINIVTRKMQTDGFKTDLRLGAGSYGTFQGEFTNRFRKGKFFTVLSGQYARSDNNRKRMGFEQYGGYAKVGYDISRYWTTYADIDLTHFNASYPGAVQAPLYDARQWITRGVATFVVENHYGKTSGAFSVYHNFGRHKINDGHSADEPPVEAYFRSDDALTGISWYQSVSLLKGNRLTVGLDYQHIFGKAWNKSIATGEVLQPLIGNKHENEIAGYVDFRQDLFSWMTVDAGLRVDHHSETGTELVPQGGLVFRLVKDGELKAMVSKGFRNPTIRELYFWKPANTALAPERLMNYEVSWQQRLLDNTLRYGVNFYYIHGDNMIQTQMVDGRPLNVNTGAVTNKGIEAEWSWRINRHWGVNNNYSYLHMKNPVLGAPEFKAWIGADYTAGRWSLNGGLQYVNGLYTQTGKQEVKEHYCLLNLTAEYKALKNLTLWVRGENLLAQRYEIIYGYPMPRAIFMGGVNLRF